MNSELDIDQYPQFDSGQIQQVDSGQYPQLDIGQIQRLYSGQYPQMDICQTQRLDRGQSQPAFIIHFLSLFPVAMFHIPSLFEMWSVVPSYTHIPGCL
jgi:hypothetical protein